MTQAVEESWVARDCAFGGLFGACGLYRREAGPQREGDPDLETATITDLGRESLASWFERRVAGGFARRAARSGAAGAPANRPR